MLEPEANMLNGSNKQGCVCFPKISKGLYDQLRLTTLLGNAAQSSSRKASVCTHWEAFAHKTGTVESILKLE